MKPYRPKKRNLDETPVPGAPAKDFQKRKLDAPAGPIVPGIKQATLAFAPKVPFGLPPQSVQGKASLSQFPEFVKLYAWNVNGANRVMQDQTMQKFLDQFKPDLFCISESKADPFKIERTLKFMLPVGYEQYWNCCQARGGYSGVCLFTKVKPLHVTFGIGIEKHDQEGRVITAEFKDFVIVTVYTPNSGHYQKRLAYRTEEWDKDFFKYLDSLKSKNKAVICCGDMNVAHKDIDTINPLIERGRPGCTEQERTSFGEGLEKYDFVDTFRALYPKI